MIEKTFSIIDYLVFALFLSSSAFIGVFFGWKDRKKSSNSEFLTGGRNLDLFPVSMSLIASFLSSNTILGVPSEIYLYGTQYWIHLIGFTAAIFLAANVFMPVYYKLNLTSVHKYLLRRFGLNVVRIFGSIGFILCTLPYLGVVLYGPALALASVTPISVNVSILVVGFICTFYTSIGGIKAVIWTDVLQTVLMFGGLFMVAIAGSIEVGGLVEPWRIAYNNNRLVFINSEFSLYRGDIFWSVFFGTLTGWTGTYCVKQTQVQRYCCMGSPSKAKKTLYWNIPGVWIISGTAIWCGVVIFAVYHKCDPISLKLIEKHDQLLPFFTMQKLSQFPGLPGLFVSCVFSGSLSTLSSGFNALATVTWDDFFKSYYRDVKEKKQLIITKLIAMSYGLLAICIAFIVGRLGTVLQASYGLSGSITGPLLALFCLGIFFPFVNAFGALTGLVSGISTCLFITFGTIIYPRPKAFQLPVFVNGCSNETRALVSDQIFESAANKQYYIDYQPEGILKIIHINYMYIPIIGFITTLIIGLIVSVIFEKIFSKNKLISEIIAKNDRTLVSPIVSKLCPNCVQSNKPEKDITGSNNLTVVFQTELRERLNKEVDNNVIDSQPIPHL